MHANFGPLGVVFSSLLVGIGLYVLADVFRRLPLGPTNTAATAFLALHYQSLTGTGFSSFVIDTTLVAVIVVTLTGIALGARPVGTVGNLAEPARPT